MSIVVYLIFGALGVVLGALVAIILDAVFAEKESKGPYGPPMQHNLFKQNEKEDSIHEDLHEPLTVESENTKALKAKIAHIKRKEW